MTGDPERLLSPHSGADALERDLLSSVHHVGPPEGAKDRAWQAMAGSLAVVALVGTASTSGAAAATKAGLGALVPAALASKVLALVAAGGVAVGGSYWLLASSAQAPVVAVAARSTAKASLPAPLALPSAVVAPPASALPVTDALPAVGGLNQRAKASPPLDALKAESALLTEARAQLRAGDAAAAQASVERLALQFPKGVLTQEREVLAIEVLSARGNAAGASRRAKAFVKAYPKSPHSSKLSRFLEP